MSDLAYAGSGHPLTLNTYDVLCAINTELRVSSELVNGIARIASVLFPQKIEYFSAEFIPNIWMNRVMLQVADGRYMAFDPDLWHNVVYYLKNFAGIDWEQFHYSSRTNMEFSVWFEEIVRTLPTVTIQTEKSFDAIPQDVATKDYVEIVNRMSVSIYVMDVFGSSPRNSQKSISPIPV